MRSVVFVLAGVGIGLVSGCGPTYSGAVARTAACPGSVHQLGRTAVVVACPPVERVAAELQESLRRDAHVEVIDSGPILAALKDEKPEAVSDITLVEAARKIGADTVMLVSVAEWKWGFGILPPTPASGTVRYEIRVLDVRTGRMLLVMNRSCACAAGSVQEFVEKTPSLISQDMTQISAASRPAA